MNLWKPYQAMCDIWSGSVGTGAGLVSLWWTMAIVSNVINQIAMRMTMHGRGFGRPDLDLLTTAQWVSIAGEVASVVAGFVTIMLIYNVAKAQKEKFRTMRSQVPAATAIGATY